MLEQRVCAVVLGGKITLDPTTIHFRLRFVGSSLPAVVWLFGQSCLSAVSVVFVARLLVGQSRTTAVEPCVALFW